jgi:hypothetical protein
MEHNGATSDAARWTLRELAYGQFVLEASYGHESVRPEGSCFQGCRCGPFRKGSATTGASHWDESCYTACSVARCCLPHNGQANVRAIEEGLPKQRGLTYSDLDCPSWWGVGLPIPHPHFVLEVDFSSAMLANILQVLQNTFSIMSLRLLEIGMEEDAIPDNFEENPPDDQEEIPTLENTNNCDI